MPILHTGKTILFNDVNVAAVDAGKIRPSVRFHGNHYGGLVIRAYPRVNSDGLIVLSADDRRALRHWLDEEGN